MNKEPQFYQCSGCNVIFEAVSGDNSNINCCGVAMEEMHANTSEGAAEKHIPVTEINENEVIVKVGTIFHPMLEEHNIMWVQLTTEKGCQRVYLKPSQEPVAAFALVQDDKPIAVYAYCNLHGLWKMDI